MYHKKPLRLSAWYAYCCLGEFVLIYPVYLIMMEESGISPAGLAALLAIWSGSSLLLEVPSGVISDLFDRKKVLITGTLITGCAFVIWIIWPTFWGFALGFLIWSVGSSLESGTAEAYLYEAIDDPQQFQKVYARTEAITSTSVATALLLGGYIAEGGYTLALFLSVLAPVAGGLIALLFFPTLTTTKRQPGKIWGPFFATMRSGAHAVGQTPILRFVIFVPATVCALGGVMEEFIGVIFKELDYTLTTVGIIYAAVWFARTIGSLVAEKLPPSLTLPLIISLVGGVSLLLMVTLNFALGILVALVAFFGTTGIIDVIYGARLQHEIEDQHRATITSISTMAQEIVGIFGFFAFGAIAQGGHDGSQWFSLVYAYAWLGILFAGFWLVRYRSKVFRT